MNVTLIVIVASLALLLPAVTSNDGGYKILGGFTKRFSSQTASDFVIDRKWGFIFSIRSSVNENEVRAGNIVYVDGGHGVCYRGYCRLIIVVGGPNNPYPNNYQVLGGKLLLKNRGSTYTIKTEGWGIQEAYGELEEIRVLRGNIWSTKINNWGYGYISFIVNSTTLPSNVDSFAIVYKKRTDPTLTSDLRYIGQRDPQSEPHLMSEIQSTSRAFGDSTIAVWTIYVAPTELVDYVVQNALSSLTSEGDAIIDSLTLENYGYGLTSTNLAKVGTTDTVDISSTSTLSQTFDFAIDVSISVEFSVFGNGASFGTNIHFGYSNTRELSETKTVSKSISVSWPNECPSGLRVVHRFHSLSQSLEMPVEFFFERAGIRWTEINELFVTLRKLNVDANTCCLFESASEHCGQPFLPLC